MTELLCDNCHDTADSVKAAIEHVTAYPSHCMGGPVDDEGTTVTISGEDVQIDDDEDPDYWDSDEDDEDWADE